MRWGRRWGRWPVMQGFPDRVSHWGGEWDDPNVPQGIIKRKIYAYHGKFVPCDTCRRKSNCAIFRSAIRTWRNQELNQGGTYLADCTIYLPLRMPGSNHREVPRDRTSGKQPT